MPFRIGTVGWIGALLFLFCLVNLSAGSSLAVLNETAPIDEHFLPMECEVAIDRSKAECNGTEFVSEEKVPPGSARFWLNIFIILLCVCTAGMFLPNCIPPKSAA
jgi:hypothetical protein